MDRDIIGLALTIARQELTIRQLQQELTQAQKAAQEARDGERGEGEPGA